MAESTDKPDVISVACGIAAWQQAGHASRRVSLQITGNVTECWITEGLDPSARKIKFLGPKSAIETFQALDDLAAMPPGSRAEVVDPVAESVVRFVESHREGD